MTGLDDHQLLAEFARGDSEAAFAALVQRHINLVYSVALRQTGNPHAAEEITQAVFIILARKATALSPKTILSGWLYQTARLTAANYQRTEARRVRREQEAFMQSQQEEPHTDEAWQRITPLLDVALGKLGERDRNAIVLRFFEGKSLGEVGAELGASEDAAKMRVNRALEKLRKIFGKRGVMLTTTLIAGAVSANSVQAAPAGLAVTVAAAAKGTLVSATITTLVKGTMQTMTWLKLKLAAGVGLAVLVAGGMTTIALSSDSAKTVAKAGQPQDPVLIVPGARVGKVRKGMTTNEVEVALGKPEKWQGRMMIYDRQLGMSVAQGKAGALAIFCGDSMLKYPGVKKFKGRTKEGIGMESSREAVITAFGPPTTAKPWNAGQEQLEYKTLGLTFTLEAGKVINILVDFRGVK